MRLRSAVGSTAVGSGMMLLAGLITLGLGPMPSVDVQAMALDGSSLLSAAVPEVSPRPSLLVQVDHALHGAEWQLALDGGSLSVSPLSLPSRQLRIEIPGPLPMGSRHTLQLTAGTTRVRTTFQVVPPLTATVEMRLRELRVDAPASVAATVRFSRPVLNRHAAQAHVIMTGKPTFSWKDARTLEVVAGGFHLSDRVALTVDPGVQAADGSYSRAAQTAALSIPSSLNQVVPGRMVQMYYVNTDDGHAALYSHLHQIDVLSPGWYDANADGSITGYAHQDVIDVAHANGIALIPLVVNAGVDPDVGHAIIADQAHRSALAQNLVNEAKTFGYAGFQLDFEQIRWTDRDLLTALVQDCASAFHAAGLNLSIAVIPRLPGDDTAAGVLLDYFHTWSGAYDFPALARSADFISFMTYDEHNGVTPAGPVSGTPWMRKALEFSLQGVPPEKATLGLPTYYHDWTGVGRLTSSSYADAMTLAQTYGATPAIDPTEQEMHFSYTAYGVQHELWIQTPDTLKSKLPLIYEYGLKGISVWRLGFEDPAFWNLIPPRH